MTNTILERPYYEPDREYSEEEKERNRELERAVIGTLVQNTQLLTPREIMREVHNIFGLLDNEGAHKEERNYIDDQVTVMTLKHKRGEPIDNYQTLKQIITDPEHLEEFIHFLDINIDDTEYIKNAIEEEDPDKSDSYSITDLLIQSSVIILRPHFHEPYIKDIVSYLSGACVWNDHDISIPKRVIQNLSKNTIYENNQENNLLNLIEQTYNKVRLEGKKKVKGISGLENILGGKNNPNYKYLKNIVSVKTDEEENGEEEEELDDLDKIRILTTDLVLFKDQRNKRYVNIDHINYELNNEKVELYIRHICKNSEFEFIPSPETINTFIKELESRAEFEGEMKHLEVRVASDPNDPYIWYYDLCDKKGTSIKITSEGWEVETNTPILFKRFNNMQSQVIPIKVENNIEYWKRYIKLFNLKTEEDKQLFSVKNIFTFVPNVDRIITMTHGKQGGGKSMSQELEKRFTDPCVPLTLSLPETRNELIQILEHNHNAMFDNISFVSDSYADIFCRSCTGGGFIKRALYENDEDFPYDFRRNININGINLTTNRPDVRDRTIIIEQDRISESERKDKEEIRKEYDEIAPYALGYIMDKLVEVIKLKKRGEDYVKKSNRMLHFHKYGELISTCLDYKKDSFTKIYNKSISNQSSQIVGDEFSCQVLISWFEVEPSISEESMTSPEFYKRMRKFAVDCMGLNKYGDSKRFPDSEKGLTERLNRFSVDLLNQGIEYTTKHTNKGTRISVRKVIKIIKEEDEEESNSCKVDFLKTSDEEVTK